ncbi:hypothetical protein [Pontivivens ytuae]|uniref:Uncharacterized protein n=1 Tax=Pontivivens ytuae TaxID=2789856 RepID=A0A7S9LQ57_9RHOB|nr:hypothetical protein [Pontivivens ytuae]QPH53244.1 hypothetical protein I0K15_15830 [Pontivivens ytuae]
MKSDRHFDRAIPDAPHPRAGKLLHDIRVLRARASRYGYTATAEALHLAGEMMEVEEPPLDRNDKSFVRFVDGKGS